MMAFGWWDCSTSFGILDLNSDRDYREDAKSAKEDAKQCEARSGSIELTKTQFL